MTTTPMIAAKPCGPAAEARQVKAEAELLRQWLAAMERDR